MAETPIAITEEEMPPAIAPFRLTELRPLIGRIRKVLYTMEGLALPQLSTLVKGWLVKGIQQDLAALDAKKLALIGPIPTHAKEASNVHEESTAKEGRTKGRAGKKPGTNGHGNAAAAALRRINKSTARHRGDAAAGKPARATKATRATRANSRSPGKRRADAVKRPR